MFKVLLYVLVLSSNGAQQVGPPTEMATIEECTMTAQSLLTEAQDILDGDEDGGLLAGCAVVPATSNDAQ